MYSCWSVVAQKVLGQVWRGAQWQGWWGPWEGDLSICFIFTHVTFTVPSHQLQQNVISKIFFLEKSIHKKTSINSRMPWACNHLKTYHELVMLTIKSLISTNFKDLHIITFNLNSLYSCIIIQNYKTQQSLSYHYHMINIRPLPSLR